MADRTCHQLPQALGPRNGQDRAPPLKEFLLATVDDTLAFGSSIGRSASGATVIALRGGLGSGKTVLAKGIARGLGIEDEVTSPSYTIVSEYEGRLRLHHVDAWRLGDPEEFTAIGGGDLLGDPDGITVIEWSERIAGLLPQDAITIELEPRDDDSRLVRVTGPMPNEWMPA
ncbi:MAG: tRNA (adenosine(37)-N6)-threonylcarbamoyltransferase complex ATPase subunit type 1 TsaE [Spirochaetota bacterium]